MSHKNMTRLVCASFAALAVLSGCASTPHAVADASVMAEPGSPEAKAELALRLAAQARRDRDAKAMLVASRLMLTSGTRPATLNGGELTVETGADPIVTAWAQEAIVFAGDDEELRAEGEAILAMRPRGILQSSLGAGPLRYVRRISANQTVSFDIRAEPQLAARVAAIGDGDARIGLNVSASAGDICDSVAITTHSLCTWEAATDRHKVTLENAGPLDSDVMLLSN